MVVHDHNFGVTLAQATGSVHLSNQLSGALPLPVIDDDDGKARHPGAGALRGTRLLKRLLQRR